MSNIDQSLLNQQQQEKELRESQLAAQNEAAQGTEPATSISQATAARDTKKSRPTTEEPEDIEANLRAEQIEAQNREAQSSDAGEKSKAEAMSQQIQQIQKAAKSAKTAARTVNFTTGVTIIGLGITFITMNLQFLVGNIFGAKWVPKLEIWEIAIIGMVDFLLWLTIMILVGLISLIANCAGSVTGAAKCGIGMIGG